jgi:outer membrane protein assembly factor BamB
VVVVQSEAQGDSFVEALDAQNGATRWQLDRPRQENYSSPLAIQVLEAGELVNAVVLQSNSGLDLHRAANGEQLARFEVDCASVPSAAFDKQLLVPANGLTVFDLNLPGGLPGELPGELEVHWQESRLGTGSASPVVYGGKVYTLNSGVLSCGDLATRQIAWKKRLSGQFWSTPIAAGSFLYCINSDGKAFVVDVTDEGRIEAEVEFGEEIWASPAAANGALFVRSHQHLWKIAATGGK